MGQYNQEQQRLMGNDVTKKYEEHAQSPHGRLRHDLLYKYYDAFLTDHPVKWIIDVGGGTGLLMSRLVKKYPSIRAVVIDDDAAMIEKAKERLLSDKNGRIEVIKGNAISFPDIYKNFNITDEKVLVSFNHAIEYIEDKKTAIKSLTEPLMRDCYFGIMYLNNSHEAYRKLMLKESIRGVVEQLQSYKLDMVHFGFAEALDTETLGKYTADNNLRPIREYGMRCISDFKSKDFVDRHYNELFDVEYEVGKLHDFIGLSRYRLHFYQKK